MLPARSAAIGAFAAENDRRFTGAVDISTDQEATDGTTFLALEARGQPEEAMTSAITTKSGKGLIDGVISELPTYFDAYPATRTSCVGSDLTTS